MKQLCKIVISVIIQFEEVVSGDFDWTSICSPLVTMLFSTDEVISCYGKITLLSLLEKNRNITSVLMQLGFIDRTITSLSRSLQTSSSSSSGSNVERPSSVFTLNILTILESILTNSTEKISISTKINEILEKIKQELKIDEIKQKSQFILSKIVSIQKEDKKIERNENELIKQLEQRLNEQKSKNNQIELEKWQIEKKMVEFEYKTKIGEQKLKQNERNSQEMDDLLKFINNFRDSSEITKDDWNEIIKDLQKESKGTDDQKEQIRSKKLKTCQKIVAEFIGKDNPIKKKQAIDAGVVDALLQFLSIEPLDHLTISHAWAFYTFTYSTDEIRLTLYQRNPFPVLLRLAENQNVFVVSRAVASMFHMIEAGTHQTDANEIHPHFASMEACNGTMKLFNIFKACSHRNTKIAITFCIGHLFKAQQITNIEMRKEVIAYLKSILTDNSLWIRFQAKDSLSNLAQNSGNISEILKDVDLNKVASNMRKKFDCTDKEKKEIQTQWEKDCWLLSAILEGKTDDKLRQIIINSGVVDALLGIFLSRPLDVINQPLSYLISNMTSPASDAIQLQFFDKSCYPSLIRVLESEDVEVVSDIITSILNIVIAGFNSKDATTQHPHLASVESCDGIQKLFQLFQKDNLNKHIRDTSSICIGYLFRAKEIVNLIMRKQIISHLRSLTQDVDELTKINANIALSHLAINDANRKEIERQNSERSYKRVFQQKQRNHSQSDDNLVKQQQQINKQKEAHKQLQQSPLQKSITPPMSITEQYDQMKIDVPTKLSSPLYFQSPTQSPQSGSDIIVISPYSREDASENDTQHDEQKMMRYLCGISGKIMDKPMKTHNGKFYDFKNIQQYLNTHNGQDPDNQPLEMTDLVFDEELQKEIQSFVANDPFFSLVESNQ
ncbi:MAG: hypothetical protein EZS28_010502 [Streblomastix strix]|uniref:RING-type E3 ubiquitin transferase n=1 Tax=Streblomastix strix TaxID=222440 RepID=A0A5J4WHY6_9EUKA|nr:MAG: hypothetical protein EZS28_010502 [Streblomastix strix]